ncbi:hypothetical protein D3C74_227920 [compost metagenome]
MLRPVEFNPPGNPWPSQANQRRFDDTVVVDEIVVVCFVERTVNPPAQLRHDLDTNIFVLENRQPIADLLLLVVNLIDDRMRVDPSGTALINAFFQKHRVFVRLPHPVRRNELILFPDSYRGPFGSLPLLNVHIQSSPSLL